MNLWSCCILKWDELHVQSCHSYRLRESDDVATQRAGDVFLYAFRKTCMQCHVSWSVDTWIMRVFVSSFACSGRIRNRQRQPSVKGKIHAWIFWIVALWIAMSCMSSRAMHNSCSRIEMTRDGALEMFFYMRAGHVRSACAAARQLRVRSRTYSVC